jgi:hypothetical protein
MKLTPGVIKIGVFYTKFRDSIRSATSISFLCDRHADIARENGHLKINVKSKFVSSILLFTTGD